MSHSLNSIEKKKRIFSMPSRYQWIKNDRHWKENALRIESVKNLRCVKILNVHLISYEKSEIPTKELNKIHLILIVFFFNLHRIENKYANVY